MEKWSGKLAVVTGASAGIGAAIVQALAHEGINVVGLARRKERVEELAAKFKDAPGKIHAVECDVSKPESIQKAFEWIESNLGGIDILVNNAGSTSVAHIFDLSKDESNYISTIETNLTGLLLVTRRAFKTMQERPFGYIININSIAGQNTASEFSAKAGFNVYAPTKHAVTQLTKLMKMEITHAKKNIRITSISPGLIRTEFDVAAGTPLNEQAWNAMPHLVGKDIADQIIYLLGTNPNVNISELTIEPLGQNVNLDLMKN